MNDISNSEWKQLCELLNGYIRTQVLNTACELEIFNLLAKKPKLTTNEIADELSISLHGTRILLMGLCESKLLESINGRYSNTELASKAFVSTSPTSISYFVKLNSQLQLPGCLEFTKALKTGKNSGLDIFPGDAPTLYKRIKNDPRLESIFQKGMGEYTKVSPQMTYVDEFKNINSLLDIGGGDGTNAIRLCQKFSNLTITILEIPTVAGIARENVTVANLSDRIKVIELDIFDQEWPRGFDAVLFSHLLEIFNEKKIIFLYQKALSVLNEHKGKVIIWTMMSNPDENGGLQAVKSSLYFYTVASGEGMAYPAKDHEHWLKQVGFKKINSSYIEDIDHGLIIASA